jgi:hypothetical protein
MLTEEEHRKLLEAIGQKNLDSGIEQLDYSITVKGGKYQDHYKTLMNWHRRGFLDKTGGNNGSGNNPGSAKTPASKAGPAQSDGEPYPVDLEFG